MLAGLKEGYPWKSQEYPSLKLLTSTILRDTPTWPIPGDIPPVARALKVAAAGEFSLFSSHFMKRGSFFSILSCVAYKKVVFAFYILLRINLKVL